MNEELITSEELIKEAKQANPQVNDTLITKAYDFAKAKHKDQKRDSGNPYFVHPLNVARILIKMNADSATVTTALLHDVVEDTSATLKDVKDQFGEEIAELVNGVTKIRSVYFESKEEYGAENIRKVVLATAKDVRVILIKLADKVHNMRTLKYKPEEKQKITAQEVLDIYAPIAYKLGMYRIKAELEDLSLRYLNPDIYYELKEKIAIKKEDREKEIKTIVQKIQALMQEKKIPVHIAGRTKHFYSIYTKMQRRNKKFEDIHDLYAIRIVTNTIEECYQALGIIHSTYRPIPYRFKDYIANPKQNMYQSIHTEIIFEGKPIEVQIRSKNMHLSAEDGVAAHWRFKNTERDKKFDQKITWLKHILKWKATDSAKQFIEDLKIDLFGDEIIVFTPKGDPITLPEEATIIDFAYQVHTDIGNHCARAKVNREIVSLDHELKSGDIVEIVTAKNAAPSRNWLKIAKTTFARSHIRSALNIKGIQQDGEEQKIEGLLWKKVEVLDEKMKAPVKLSKCCSPEEKDTIVGFLTKDKKITVHKKECSNIHTLSNAKEVPVKWKKGKEENTKQVGILVTDRVGLLAEVLNIIAHSGINVRSIHTDTVREKINILITLQYESKDALEKVLNKIKGVKNVISVYFQHK